MDRSEHRRERIKCEKDCVVEHDQFGLEDLKKQIGEATTLVGDEDIGLPDDDD